MSKNNANESGIVADQSARQQKAREAAVQGDAFSLEERTEALDQHVLPLLLSTIMESSNDYAFAKDKDFRYICCSPAFLRLAGLNSEADVAGKTDDELFPASMAEQFRQNDLFLLESDKPIVDFDEIVYAKDGTPHYCRASKYILRDAAGASIGIYGVSRDITEEHSALERLRLVNDTIPGGLATYSFKDGELRIVYCNDGFCKLFGGSREGLYKRVAFNPIEFVFEEDRASLLTKIHALVESNAPVDVLFRCHMMDGGYKWINEKAIATERHGDTTLFNAILFDVTERQTVNEQLRISEEENNLAIQQGGSVVCRYDVAKKSLTLSPRVAAAYAIPERIDDVPYEPVRLGYISPDSADAYVAFFEAICNGDKTGSVIYQQRYFGDWRWMKGVGTTIFSDDGRPVKAIVSLFDITDSLEQEAVFKKWQHSMQERAENSYTLFRCNLNKNASYETKEGTLISFAMDGEGRSFNDLARTYADQCVYPEDQERYLAFVNADAMLASYYRGKRSDTFEYREFLPGGTAFRWLRISVDLVEHVNSKDIDAYLMYEDVNDAKCAELEAKERAELDPLTKILNRAAFEEKVNERIRAAKPNAMHALLMLDLDGFKLLNDMLGHGAGDDALIDIAKKLRSAARHDDCVGRLGGDEFVMFLDNIPSERIIVQRAQQICELARKSYSVEVQVSASVGISIFPRDGENFEALYKKADDALYFVKGSGKNNFAFYRDGITNDLQADAPAPSGGVALKKPDVKRRMLIVDDNKMDCELLIGLFKNDFRVDVAHDGASALKIMHHYGSALSIVLLDLMMSGIDGFAVLNIMQKDAGSKGIPVIVVSGDDDRDTVLKVISYGASDLVSKPIDPDLLRIRVNSAISKVENERLRAQNSLLAMSNDEISSYQTVLEQLKTAVIVNYWINGSYMYSHSVSALLAGKYDNRPLWRIWLSDRVADSFTVHKIQELVHDVANDRDRTEEQTTAMLKAADGTVRFFDIRIFKETNARGLAEKMMLALKAIENKN